MDGLKCMEYLDERYTINTYYCKKQVIKIRRSEY